MSDERNIVYFGFMENLFMFSIERIVWLATTLKQAAVLVTLLAGIVMLPYAAAVVPRDMLVIGKAADPQTLDPAITIDNNDWTITYPSYQRLVRYKTEKGKASTQVEGELAESWVVSDEGRVWTFTLKPGNRFDDGSDVNADAVKWSFERLIASGHGPAEAFPADLQITVIEPMKVRFTLKTAFAPFLYTLANNGASIVNPAIAKTHREDNGKAWLSNHTAGSGPYKLQHWQKGQQLVLVPNP
jgi:peptide/nickel transport system substrate-binding protein